MANGQFSWIIYKFPHRLREHLEEHLAIFETRIWTKHIFDWNFVSLKFSQVEFLSKWWETSNPLYTSLVSTKWTWFHLLLKHFHVNIISLLNLFSREESEKSKDFSFCKSPIVIQWSKRRETWKHRVVLIRFWVIKTLVGESSGKIWSVRFWPFWELNENWSQSLYTKSTNLLHIFIFRPYFIWERKIFKSNGFFFFFFYKICQDFIYI